MVGISHLASTVSLTKFETSDQKNWKELILIFLNVKIVVRRTQRKYETADNNIRILRNIWKLWLFYFSYFLKKSIHIIIEIRKSLQYSRIVAWLLRIRDRQWFWFFRLYSIMFEIWNFSSSLFAIDVEKWINRDDLFYQDIQEPRYLSRFFDTLKHSFDIHWLHSWISVIHDVRSALDFAAAKELKNRFPLISQRWSLL